MIDKSSYSTDDYDWDAILRHLPLIDTDEFAGPRLEFWKDMVRNPSYGKWWRKLSLNGRFEQIKAPALVIGGWFDPYAKQVFELFNGIRYQGGSETAQTYTRIIVGPWGHGLDTPRIGELEFGYNAVIGVPDIIRKYIESFITLDGKPQDVETPVRIFVMGTNVWRDEYEWPLARTRWVKTYLSGGNANTVNGNGELSFAPPTSNAPVKRFVYDPTYPVPTRGGSILYSKDCGPMDQREIESRPDVLVFTSEILSEDLEVTGPVIMKLFASSSAMDTDFTAKLVDVYPDGRTMSVCDGIIRARYRDGFEKPKRLIPCKVYEFTIDLWVTSNVFLKGHHLRLEISSSNFPRFDRNPNTGHEFGIDAELRVAKQSVYHSKQYPSRLILPVIPR